MFYAGASSQPGKRSLVEANESVTGMGRGGRTIFDDQEVADSTSELDRRTRRLLNQVRDLQEH